MTSDIVDESLLQMFCSSSLSNAIASLLNKLLPLRLLISSSLLAPFPSKCRCSRGRPPALPCPALPCFFTHRVLMTRSQVLISATPHARARVHQAAHLSGSLLNPPSVQDPISPYSLFPSKCLIAGGGWTIYTDAWNSYLTLYFPVKGSHETQNPTS